MDEFFSCPEFLFCVIYCLLFIIFFNSTIIRIITNHIYKERNGDKGNNGNDVNNNNNGNNDNDNGNNNNNNNGNNDKSFHYKW